MAYLMRWCVVVLCAVWGASASAAAYMKYDGISGDFVIEQASAGIGRIANGKRASGIFAPEKARNAQQGIRNRAGTLKVLHTIDKSSPKLRQLLRSKKPLGTVTLTGFKGQGKQGKYVIATFRNLKVMGIRQKRNGLEEVSFGYTEVEWTYIRR